MALATSLPVLTIAIALLVTARELQGSAAWLAYLAATATLLATLYLNWRGRRSPAQLRIDVDGIHTPNLFTGGSRLTPWSRVHAGELRRANGRPQLTLHRANNPFAITLTAAALQQPERYADIVRQVSSVLPAHAWFDRERADPPRPYVTLCWVLLLLGCAIAARMLPFESVTLQQLSFGALQRELVTTGDWFRLHSFALAHMHMPTLAITLVLTAAASSALEARLGHSFTAAMLTGSNLLVGVALLLFAGPALQSGALGACYGAIGAMGMLALAPARAVDPARRVSVPWWLPPLLLLQIGVAIANAQPALIASISGAIAGALITWLHLRATSARSTSVHTEPADAAAADATDAAAGAGTHLSRLLDRCVAWLMPASFVLACAALVYTNSTQQSQAFNARLLQTNVPAGTVLDLSDAIARDTEASDALQARAFVALSDPDRAGMAALDSGSTGIRRADTLAVLAYRQSMLAEARAHGWDALRRAENESQERQQRLWARLAVYESSARLPAFVPAAVLVRADTLCVLVPRGNPRQYLRAVVTVRDRITGLLLGTVDPGETSCIPAKGLPANAHVALTAAERAVLTSDLRLYEVDTARAALPARARR